MYKCTASFLLCPCCISQTIQKFGVQKLEAVLQVNMLTAVYASKELKGILKFPFAFYIFIIMFEGIVLVTLI